MKKFYLLFCLLGSVPALAQFCSPLNRNFGVNGLAVNYQLQSKSNEYDDQFQLRHGPGGKILQVAHAYSVNDDWIVMQRFLPDGSKDLSFGDKGVVIYDSASIYHFLHDLAYLENGSFLLAGIVYYNSKSSGWIARFHADGKEDYAFRTKASANVLVREEQTQLRAVSPLRDGRILIAVNRYVGISACGVTNSYPAVFLTCLLPDGTTDFSFGDNGVVRIQSASSIIQNPRLSVLDNGKFLVASEAGGDCGCETDAYYGTIYLGCKRQDLLMQRFGPDGRVDLSFGNQGTLLDTSASLFLNALQIQPDQKILVLSGWQRPSLRRYHPDGNRDGGFGSNGAVGFEQIERVFGEGAINLSGVVAQDDGKIVVVGTAYNKDQSVQPLFIQLERGGILDTSFSTSGWSDVLENNKQGSAQLYGVSIGNGQVVAGGRKVTATAADEIFVAAVSGSNRRIYPEIRPSEPIILCYNDSMVVSTPTAGTYQWYKDDKPLLGSTLPAINVKNFFQGRVAVNVVNNDGCGLSKWVDVTTRAENFPGFIQWTGTELVASSGFARYQWYLDNVPIAGATSVRYSPGTSLGSYTFRGWDSFDCSVLSPAFALVITGVSDVTLGDAQIRFFPNPVRTDLVVQHRSNSLIRASFELYDQTGRKLLDKTLQSGRNTINLGSYKNGMYTIILRNGKDYSTQKLMILHD